VIKDGLQLSEKYERLISKVSKLVTKCRKSTVLADELRAFSKKVHQKNVTRWNSILFMIRSVIKLRPEEVKAIMNLLPKKKKAKVELTKSDYEMLTELEKVLSIFEFATDEFQSNLCSISRVYPSILLIKHELLNNLDDAKFTKELRKDLYDRLAARFDTLIENDVFKLATFLDPNFGLEAFRVDHRPLLLQCLKKHLKSFEIDKYNTSEILFGPMTRDEALKSIQVAKPSYLKFSSSDKINNNLSNLDSLDHAIQDYVRLSSNSPSIDPFDFWKKNQQSMPILAELAMKVLGVPASSGSVERMFNISGNIFSDKRRKIGIKLLERLVFLKLNEKFF
jgi:hypothetical protein